MTMNLNKTDLEPGDEVIITKKGKFLTDGVIKQYWDNDGGNFKHYDCGFQIYCNTKFSYGNSKYGKTVNKGLYVFIINEIGQFRARAKSWSPVGYCKIERKMK